MPPGVSIEDVLGSEEAFRVTEDLHRRAFGGTRAVPGGEQRYREMCETSGQPFFLARVGGRQAGVGQCSVTERGTWLGTAGVLPEHRGKGTGFAGPGEGRAARS